MRFNTEHIIQLYKKEPQNITRDEVEEIINKKNI